MITYVIPGIRQQVKEITDRMAGDWVIISRKSPYIVIEQHDLEKMLPLDNKTAAEIKEEAQIIKDNLEAELRVIEEEEL